MPVPATKGGNQPPKGGKGSGKGKKAPGSAHSKGGKPHKSGSLAAGGGHKKRSNKKKAKWTLFIHRLLKTLNENRLTISSRAMSIMGSLVEDLFERIHKESVNIAKINDKRTLTAREVQTAARLLLPKELAKHAMSEGTKAVAKYNASRQGEDADATF